MSETKDGAEEKGGVKWPFPKEPTPKQYFGFMAVVIALGIVIQVTNFRYIPGILIFAAPAVGVIWGARMVWVRRQSPNFPLLAVATGVTALVAIVMGISLGTSVGDPVIEEGNPSEVSDLYNSCADGDMYDCDQLFMQAPAGSDEQAFGSDCGGRGYQVGVWCSEEGAEEFSDYVG